MKLDNWNKLSNEEIKKLSTEDFLKHLIKFGEERHIWYKTQLEFIFNNKDVWSPTDEFTIWYKDFLKYCKGVNEKHLKENRSELEFFRQGLDYPVYINK